MNEQFQVILRGKYIDLFNLHQYLGISMETADITDHDVAAIITYRVEIEARPYGIKDINITIENIKIEGTVSIDKESLTEHEIELFKKAGICVIYSDELDFYLEILVNEEWTIKNELSIQKNNGVPENIEIELTAKKINVS